MNETNTTNQSVQCGFDGGQTNRTAETGRRSPYITRELEDLIIILHPGFVEDCLRRMRSEALISYISDDWVDFCVFISENRWKKIVESTSALIF